jgi:DNA-binding transcriptional ArsR family regulator
MALDERKKYVESMISKKLAANAETAAAFLNLLGNEKRLLIMNHLAGGELSVGILAERVQLSQSALSQHLAKLRAFGLVDTRRDRQMVYYSCSSGAARELLAMLDGFLVTERPLAGPGPHYVAERLRRARAA